MQLILVFISSILWGVTNPFIRKASGGIEKIQATNTFNRIFLELKFLFTNLNVKIFIRKCGSNKIASLK
jgi:hypothetical protein